MEPTGCTETSVKNYHYSLRNDPEGCCSHVLRGGKPVFTKYLYSFSLTGSLQFFDFASDVVSIPLVDICVKNPT